MAVLLIVAIFVVSILISGVVGFVWYRNNQAKKVAATEEAARTAVAAPIDGVWGDWIPENAPSHRQTNHVVVP